MNKLFLGIDGGGTKTTIALADKEGKVIKEIDSGPSNLRNIGVRQSCENILEGIKKILPSGVEVVSTFIGLPALQEEYKDEKKYIEEKIKEEISGIVEVDSDQLVAFRSGTDSEEGMVVIAGTGGVVRGFANGKTVKVSGWGYFGDEGSAFWTGIKAYREIAKNLDGRGEKSLITEMVFKEWNLSNGDEFNKKIYSEPMKYIPKLAVFVDYGQRKGDRVAQLILEEAAEELFLSVKRTIDLLDLKAEFPLVLVGGMFRSKFLEETLVKRIKKENKKIKIIKPEKEPVFGAVKLAISRYENRKSKKGR
jgi:N-acetylglucosamine kinase-like BadF-type ATPase